MQSILTKWKYLPEPLRSEAERRLRPAKWLFAAAVCLFAGPYIGLSLVSTPTTFGISIWIVTFLAGWVALYAMAFIFRGVRETVRNSSLAPGW